MERSSKPQFIPPLKTAASYLRNISYTPKLTQFEATPKIFSDSELKQSIHRSGSQNFKLSLTVSDRNLLRTSSKFTRDISHLQDVIQPHKLIGESISSINILPTTIEQLKAFTEAKSRIERRCKSKRTHVCFKESCLENVLTNETNGKDKKIFDETYRNHLEMGPPTGTYDIANLKEWYKYMKENFISKYVFDGKTSIDGFAEQLENYELILKSGLKECIRQITVQSFDRGDLLSDLLADQNDYWKSKYKYYESYIKQLKEESQLQTEANFQKSLVRKKAEREKERKVKII